MLTKCQKYCDTKNQIVYYTILLVILSYTPLYSNLIGYLYFVYSHTVLNIFLVQNAFKLKKSVEVKDSS